MVSWKQHQNTWEKYKILIYSTCNDNKYIFHTIYSSMHLYGYLKRNMEIKLNNSSNILV